MILICAVSLNAQGLVSKTYDAIDNKTTWFTETDNCSIMKITEAGQTRYYLSIYAYSNYCTVNNKGVKILFSDGTKWVKLTEEIDTDASDNNKGNFRYSGFVRLNATDLKLFSTKVIIAYKVYIFDVTLSEHEALLFQSATQIIQTSK